LTFPLKEQAVIRKLWTEHDILIFTSNGVVKRNGELVMGKGIAKVVRDFYPESAKVFGALVREHGNKPYLVRVRKREGAPFYLMSFPTKHHFRKKSDLNLIRESKERALRILEGRRDGLVKAGITRILCPLWGTENGKLSLEEVEKELLDFKERAEALGFEVAFFDKNGLRRLKMREKEYVDGVAYYIGDGRVKAIRRGFEEEKLSPEEGAYQLVNLVLTDSAFAGAGTVSMEDVRKALRVVLDNDEYRRKVVETVLGGKNKVEAEMNDIEDAVWEMAYDYLRERGYDEIDKAKRLLEKAFDRVDNVLFIDDSVEKMVAEKLMEIAKESSDTSQFTEKALKYGDEMFEAVANDCENAFYEEVTNRLDELVEGFGPSL